MTQNDRDEHWQASMQNNVKINSDATIFENTNGCSHAFVVRDHESSLVKARSKCLKELINPDLTEVLRH